jgi:hypothetical protein
MREDFPRATDDVASLIYRLDALADAACPDLQKTVRGRRVAHRLLKPACAKRNLAI